MVAMQRDEGRFISLGGGHCQSGPIFTLVFRECILSITKITARIVTGNLSKRSLIYFKKVKYASIKRDMFWWPESH